MAEAPTFHASTPAASDQGITEVQPFSIYKFNNGVLIFKLSLYGGEIAHASSYIASIIGSSRIN